MNSFWRIVIAFSKYVCDFKILLIDDKHKLKKQIDKYVPIGRLHQKRVTKNIFGYYSIVATI